MRLASPELRARTQAARDGMKLGAGPAQTRSDGATRKLQRLRDIVRRHPLEFEQHEDRAKVERHGFQHGIQHLERPLSLDELVGTGGRIDFHLQSPAIGVAPHRPHPPGFRGHACRRAKEEGPLPTRLHVLDAPRGHHENVLRCVVDILLPHAETAQNPPDECEVLAKHLLQARPRRRRQRGHPRLRGRNRICSEDEGVASFGRRHLQRSLSVHQIENASE